MFIGGRHHRYEIIYTIISEVFPLNEIRFFPEQEVITLANRKDIKKGSVGKIKQRWVGNIYAVVTNKYGDLDWFFDYELDPIDPAEHNIKEGDIVRVVPKEERKSGIKGGDLVRVIKAVEEISYYQILIDDELYWFTWLELAPYK